MKRFVADTHALLWWLGGETKHLGRQAARVLERADGVHSEVIVSVLSLWEVALLNDEGRLRLAAGYTAWCQALERHPGLRVESLTLADIDHARGLRTLRDPVDRLIAATALRLHAPLLTADARIASSRKVRVLWN